MKHPFERVPTPYQVYSWLAPQPDHPVDYIRAEDGQYWLWVGLFERLSIPKTCVTCRTVFEMLQIPRSSDTWFFIFIFLLGGGLSISFSLCVSVHLCISVSLYYIELKV